MMKFIAYTVKGLEQIVKEEINVKEVSSANSVKNSVNDGGK